MRKVLFAAILLATSPAFAGPLETAVRSVEPETVCIAPRDGGGYDAFVLSPDDSREALEADTSGPRIVCGPQARELLARDGMRGAGALDQALQRAFIYTGRPPKEPETPGL